MPDGSPTQTSPTPKSPVPAPRQSRAWLWSLLGGLLILGLIATVVPLTGNRTDVHTWTQILLFCVLAQSWNFIGGDTGYAAFGNVAFFGIGAYTVGTFVTTGQPFWLGLLAGRALAVPTALAGGLYAYWLTGFDPGTVFDVGMTVEMVLLTVLGGAGTILGPLIGAIIFEYGSYQLLTSNFSAHNMVLGLAIIIVTIFLPQGLVRLVHELSRWPASAVARTNRLRERVRRVRRYIAANGI